MAKKRKKLVWVGGATLFFILPVSVLVLPAIFRSDYKAPVIPEEEFLGVTEEKPDEFLVVHLATPEPVKALYMTACVAGTPSWRENLKELIETTELNAVVIDIKDYTGTVSFPNNFPRTANSKGCIVSDLREFIGELHNSGIYVIGRVSVFQDLSYAALFPELAVKSLSTGGIWKDHKGISFIDVGATPYWDYIVDISQQAYRLGFDEINYDYIRYPSDGNMQDANYTWTPNQSGSTPDGTGQVNAPLSRADMLENFFKYLSQEMKDVGVVTSADLFGMTTTVVNDMGIGQVLERALPYFDYIAPMVYPSHYPKTWGGFTNPAEYPYEVIKLAMSGGRDREVALNISNGLATTTPSKLRPWLQDFDLGADYDAAKVRAQMQATYDVGLTSWMLWSAANKYTEEALFID